MVTDLYRSGVGIMLLNTDRRILMGKRIGVESRAWQMPQGGVNNGENFYKAALRELEEEEPAEEADSE